MDEELVDLTDILRSRVYDAEGRNIGHVQDLALGGDLSSTEVSHVAVHLEWTDRVGAIRLARRAEDVVVLIPVSEFELEGVDVFKLLSRHPDLPVETAEGRLLVRRDILDKQMTDPGGNRLNRVDDVLMCATAGCLSLAGLKVSPSMLVASPGLRSYMTKLKNRFRSRYKQELVPWEAVQRIDTGSIVIGDPGDSNGQFP